MSTSNSDDGVINYASREAVGVFATPGALESAVDELEISGFDRSMISVLASDKKVRGRISGRYHEVTELEDDHRTPQTAFVSSDSRTGGEAAAVGIPIYIGGFAGTIAVVAYGGALAATIVGAVAGGIAGAGLGALLVHVIAQKHRDHVAKQLADGGMILWVNVRDIDSEEQALRILETAGASNVHMHEIERQWTLKDRPLSEVQPDPFLAHDH